MRKSIPKTTSGPTLLIKKVSSKNYTWLTFSVIEKAATTIPKVFNIIPSIFYAPMFVSLIRRPDLFAKVGWMALTLIPKSKSINTSTDFIWKVMGYQIYGTCARFFGYSYSLFLPFLPAPAISIVSTAFSLIPVTSVEIAIIDTSCLYHFRDIWCHNVSISDSYNNWLRRHLSLLSWRRWH